jgi:hypothetical protein
MHFYRHPAGRRTFVLYDARLAIRIDATQARHAGFCRLQASTMPASTSTV